MLDYGMATNLEEWVSEVSPPNDKLASELSMLTWTWVADKLSDEVDAGWLLDDFQSYPKSERIVRNYQNPFYHVSFLMTKMMLFYRIGVTLKRPLTLKTPECEIVKLNRL